MNSPRVIRCNSFGGMGGSALACELDGPVGEVKGRGSADVGTVGGVSCRIREGSESCSPSLFVSGGCCQLECAGGVG